MAANRVAEDGKGTNQILAVETTRIDQRAQTRCYCQTALTYRARLRRTKAGAWTGAFRGPKLARVLPSRKSVNCSLRLPGIGTMPFSPQAARGHSMRPMSKFAYPPGHIPTIRYELLPAVIGPNRDGKSEDSSTRYCWPHVTLVIKQKSG